MVQKIHHHIYIVHLLNAIDFKQQITIIVLIHTIVFNADVSLARKKMYVVNGWRGRKEIF